MHSTLFPTCEPELMLLLMFQVSAAMWMSYQSHTLLPTPHSSYPTPLCKRLSLPGAAALDTGYIDYKVTITVHDSLRSW